MLLKLGDHQKFSYAVAQYQKSSFSVNGKIASMVWKLTESDFNEVSGHEVEEALKACMRAYYRKLEFLPLKHSIVRCGSFLKLDVKTHDLVLSTVLAWNLKYAKELSHLLVKLLKTLITMNEKKIAIGTINPSTVTVDLVHYKIQFIDLRHVIITEYNDHDIDINPKPYNAQSYPENNFFQYDSQQQDLWSVGVILLEAFLGCHIVRNIQTHEDLERLIGLVKKYIDPQVWTLLDGMLLRVNIDIVE